jgi:uncharacterized protein
MKIIVTGGSGFIGKGLCPRLVREGHEVVVLTRTLATGPNAGVRSVVWDAATGGAWEREVDGADAVVNFAGESLDAHRWSPRQKNRLLRSRVDATMAIVNAIRKARKKPAVFISASGVGYYGPVDHGDLKEDSPRGNDFLSNVTSQWEQTAQSATEAGVRTVILRIAVVLGSGGGALRKLVIPFRLFVGGPIGTGRQWLPWVHREDLIRAVLFLLGESKIEGTINVVAPGAVTMKQFCSTLGQVMHRPSWFPVPSFVLRILLGEMSTMVLTGQRAVPARLLASGFTFKYPELAEALEEATR